LPPGVRIEEWRFGVWGGQTAAAEREAAGGSAGLAPGRVGEYNTVGADTRLLAVDCGVWQREM
jgi:hypothetical protein